MAVAISSMTRYSWLAASSSSPFDHGAAIFFIVYLHLEPMPHAATIGNECLKDEQSHHQRISLIRGSFCSLTSASEPFRRIAVICSAVFCVTHSCPSEDSNVVPHEGGIEPHPVIWQCSCLYDSSRGTLEQFYEQLCAEICHGVHVYIQSYTSSTSSSSSQTCFTTTSPSFCSASQPFK